MACSGITLQKRRGNGIYSPLGERGGGGGNEYIQTLVMNKDNDRGARSGNLTDGPIFLFLLLVSRNTPRLKFLPGRHE